MITFANENERGMSYAPINKLKTERSMSTENMNPEDLQSQFASAYGEQQFETYEQAAARKAQEEAENNNSGVPFFNTKNDGDYNIRIMPHSPAALQAGARGYSQPIKQIWLGIKKQGAKKDVNVKVVDARMCGFSVDIIQAYKYAAVGKLKARIADAPNESTKKAIEKKLAEVDASSFNGGIRFDYKHLMYLTETDTAARKEGIKQFECSNGIFKAIEEAKMKIWSKRVKNDPKSPCPISYPFGANQVILTRKTVNKKTEYTVLIDTEEGKFKLNDDEMKSLMSLPSLASYLKYNKRSYQATMVFLEQYDAKHGLGILGDEKFLEAAEKLKEELNAIKEDTSSFDLSKAGANDGDGKSGESAEEGILLDDLFGEFSDLEEGGAIDGDEEMTEFRKKIRVYIAQEAAPFRLGRSVSTAQILEDLDKYVEEHGERGIVSASGDAGDEIPKDTKEEKAVVSVVEEEYSEEEEGEEEVPAPAREARSPRVARQARAPRS